jgi:4-amino-4-deoxy-L-arabinose transferase-like glycosyltransferase
VSEDKEKTETEAESESETESKSATATGKAWWPLPQAIGRIDHGIGVGLGALYTIWLLATARSLGFPRDEGFYFHAASDYARWFDMLFSSSSQAFERANIDGIWQNNHEHPALMKSLFALSWQYFYNKWHWFSDASTAFRFPGMVMGGLALYVTYLFGARAFSRKAGALAAVLLGAMPAVFFNAHLACFDAPIMTMWLLSVYVYWRSLQAGGGWWAIAAGVVFGLTLETKHNAWILPAVFLPHAFFVCRKAIARDLRVGRLPLPTSVLAMAVIGPLVFYALWPWMWNDTFPRLQEYVSFHMNHVYYNIEYLHKNYFGPPSPRSYAPMLILATVPTTTLVLFGIGAFDRLRVLVRRVTQTVKEMRGAPHTRGEGDRAETDLLLFLAISAPLAVFVLLSKTPIFGGTKHWLPAYPFVAIFAGRGFERVGEHLLVLAKKIQTESQRLGAWAALGTLLALAPLVITSHSHPFGLSAYVPLVGGTAGGADMGLNRQFWGFTTQSLAPYLEKNPARTIFIHDTAWDSWNRMTAEKRVPNMQAVGSPSEAQVAIVHHELHMNEVDYQMWVAFGDQPDYVLTHDGVPIISAYRRK